MKKAIAAMGKLMGPCVVQYSYLIFIIYNSVISSMQFLGNWYILEYEYAEETRLNQVDCLGFKFTVEDIPLSLDMSVMTANFTFRFPPKSGFSYHVPTYAFFSDDTQAKWTTNFKNGMYSR